jgi:hypothetical protein
MAFRFLQTTLLLVMAGLLIGCGDRRPHKKAPAAQRGAVEQAFVDASIETGVPMRLLMAVGYLESGLTAHPSSASYSEDSTQLRGTQIAESAFGIPLAELGLDDQQPLPAQIKAYARWLKGRLAQLNLVSAPASPDDKYQWLTALAHEHRRGIGQRRNIRILFAQELRLILNKGFIWQDPTTGERIELGKELPELLIENMSADGQQWFSLDGRSADIDSARFYPIVTSPTNGNVPTRVEVIHCPLSMSACLELQSQPQGGDVRLAAHYLIPQNLSVIDLPMQVARHDHIVTITDRDGNDQAITDAIVVMLVGNSGRLQGGIRMPAIPTWFTYSQLRDMGNVIADVCLKISEERGSDYNECMKIDHGVSFRKRTNSELTRWGEIPDFDATIFGAYVERPGAVEDGVAFEFANDRRVFGADQAIPFKIRFQQRARLVALERLARCPSGKVVWETVDIDQVRGQAHTQIDEKFFDAGPNGNGDQFVRARVYDEKGELVGWSTDRVFLQGFEKNKVALASPKTCKDDI